MRLIHHLIAYSLLNPSPFCCAEDGDAAQAFVANEMEGKGLITLHVTSAVGPCPVCDGPSAKDRLYKQRARIGDDVTLIDPGLFGVACDHVACYKPNGVKS